jgi:hypothetical protein
METEQYTAEWSVDHWRNKEGKKFLESNENEDTIYQNFWDTEKSLLREKFIVSTLKIREISKKA